MLKRWMVLSLALILLFSGSAAGEGAAEGMQNGTVLVYDLSGLERNGSALPVGRVSEMVTVAPDLGLAVVHMGMLQPLRAPGGNSVVLEGVSELIRMSMAFSDDSGDVSRQRAASAQVNGMSAQVLEEQFPSVGIPTLCSLSAWIRVDGRGTVRVQVDVQGNRMEWCRILLGTIVPLSQAQSGMSAMLASIGQAVMQGAEARNATPTPAGYKPAPTFRPVETTDTPMAAGASTGEQTVYASYPYATVTMRGGLPLLENPSGKARTLLTLKYNREVTVLGHEGDWAHVSVEYGGKTLSGYIPWNTLKEQR